MIKETFTLVEAVKKMYPVVTFFKDRYFPDGKTFYSQKVLIESKKGGRKVAPFVVPVVNGIVMTAEGYRTDMVTAPMIAPKMAITAQDLENKAFGESPDSNRSPEDREREIEAEDINELRSAVSRRHELMCADIIVTGQTAMNHYSTAEDAAKGVNPSVEMLKYYDDEFENKYTISGDFTKMTIKEKLGVIYNITSLLRKRGVRCTDWVMTDDVSQMFMLDDDFLEMYNKRDVNVGSIDAKELPEGVVFNGTINIGGVKLNMFSYDNEFEDMDGTIKPFLPKGTMAFLAPGLGKTVYGQVTFMEDGRFVSYAEKMVPRLITSDTNNVAEVLVYSRPVPYPNDWEGWMVTNIYEKAASDDTDSHSDTTDQSNASGQNIVSDAVDDAAVDLKTEEEINKLSSKAAVIAYGESIGMTGLSDSSTLADLKTAVINYQQEHYAD